MVCMNTGNERGNSYFDESVIENVTEILFKMKYCGRFLAHF